MADFDNLFDAAIARADETIRGYPTITIRGQLSDNMVYTEKHIRIISV
ncbi:head-tail joining protein, partial [Escherichia coli]